MQTTAAVSYTHLDVYKRQTLDRERVDAGQEEKREATLDKRRRASDAEVRDEDDYRRIKIIEYD